jgi:hypothetical protein
MSNSVKEIEYKGFLVRIEQDDDPQMNPREDDNFGTIVDLNGRYALGDSVYLKEDELTDEDIVLPLYMYDHSGITISTTPFSCGWDSMAIGYVYVTAEDIRKEYNIEGDISSIDRERAKALLIAEVELYDKYIKGEIYMFVTNEDCVGGYTDIDEAVAMGKKSIDIMLDNVKESHLKTLKRWIKGNVGLQYRHPLSVGI